MPLTYAVIGAPTSAGAHHAGQDRAPAAMRERGFVEKLRRHDAEVIDAGDVVGAVWRPDSADSLARSLDVVVRVALNVADAVERESTAGRVPIVVGGDCTITVGVVAGLQRVHDDVRVAYVDGDADLGSPEHSRSGVLDATGAAHLLGIADTALSRIGRAFPMLSAQQITLFGYDPDDPGCYDADVLAARPELVHASYRDVLDDPDGCALRARDAVAVPGSAVVLHFDVDAVDSRDLALANFPHYGTGLPLTTTARCLRILADTPGLAAVVLTEVNPTHDPEHALIDRYIDAVTSSLGGLGHPR